MKKLLPVLLLLLSFNSYSQFRDYPAPNEGVIAGGLGLNWIDGDLYYTFHFTPEISFLNFGVGLDLRFDVSSEGKIREENFNDASDYLSIIRYIRYGLKNDPVFAKIGALDRYTLGHGSIMYQYNNSPGFDVRQTGFVLDIDFGQFGFESIYSSFAQAGIFGLRGFVRPLQLAGQTGIPIISNLEVGASYAGDFNDQAGIVSGFYNNTTNQLEVGIDKGNVNIVGFDLGLPVLRTDLLGIDLYFDYAKIIDFGSGIATGVNFNFDGLGLVNVHAKLERRFNNGRYIPSYFGPLYEIERFRVNPAAGVFPPVRSKIRDLYFSTNEDNGYYGELGVNVLNMFDIVGSYQRLDKTPRSGILHIHTEIAPEQSQFVARAGYDKINITNEESMFKLDDNSYLFAELGYKPVQYIIISLVYSWTYTPVRNADEDIIGYEPLKRIEPRVSFVFPFDVGN